jgi:hypothetical protein
MGKELRSPMGAKEKYPCASKMLRQLMKGEPTDHVCKRFDKPSRTVDIDTNCYGCKEVCVYRMPTRRLDDATG